MCAASPPAPRPPVFPRHAHLHTFTHEPCVGLSFALTQRTVPLPQAADFCTGVLAGFSSLVDSPGLALQTPPHPQPFSPGLGIRRVFNLPSWGEVYLKIHFPEVCTTSLQKYCVLLRNPFLQRLWGHMPHRAQASGVPEATRKGGGRLVF